MTFWNIYIKLSNYHTEDIIINNLKKIIDEKIPLPFDYIEIKKLHW